VIKIIEKGLDMEIVWNSALKSNQITLSVDLKNLFPNSQADLHYGSWTKHMEITFTTDIPSNSITLPTTISREFIIPTHVPYEIRIESSRIIIGPIIGFLLCNKHSTLDSLFEEFEDYVHSYQEINGVIMLFSSEGINILNKTIKGYYYDHSDVENGCFWKEGVFPYPSSVYRRAFIPIKKLHDLNDVIGRECIFNYQYFHKWRVYELLKQQPQIQNYLPETKRLINMSALMEMVNKHSSIYIKPVDGTYGFGIAKLVKTLDNFQFINRSGTVKNLLNERGVYNLLKPKFKKANYIVQQDVGYVSQKENVDFRVVVQKNKTKKWECTAFIARFGMIDKSYTNDPSEIRQGKEALQDIFHLSDEDFQWKIQEVYAICMGVGLVFDQLGHYGDLGIDITIDKNMEVWLLEVNHMFHDHDMAAYLDDDFETYEKVLTTLLQYLKALAGF
jgi:hypothetical protein